MRRALLWLLLGVLAVGLPGPLWAQVEPDVTLEVLNAVTPGTTVAVVVQGDPVLVEFAVSPSVDSSPSDVIHLRRIDDGSVVSSQVRGDSLTGTVSLSTAPSNALGDLEVVYVHMMGEFGQVLATAPETVRVISSGEGGPTTVTVPSTAAPTIQAAIDLVADGGTINIRPGTYWEKLLVLGKRVNLVGSGAFGFRRTMIAGALPQVVVPYEQAQGLISFGPRGGGSISNLILQGGDAGVVGFEDASGTPAAVQIKNAVIRFTGRGVLGSFGDLAIEQAAIVGSLWNGVSIVKAAGVAMADNQVVGSQNIGVLVVNYDESPGTILIANQFIAFNLKGGIVVFGSGKPVIIQNCEIYFNWVAGIILWEAGLVVVQDTMVWRVFLGQIEVDGAIYDNLADGLIAFRSGPVTVLHGDFHMCERSGMLYDSSSGLILYTTSGGANRFGLVMQGEPKPNYSDPSNTFWGTEQPILTDGALPVPEAPPLPEE